jgi:hypothetical protein
MSTMRCWGLVLFACLLGGCAHQIVITPELRSIEKPATPIDKKVGYYISPADRAVQVTSAGGGGDKVSYYPYRELEPALQKVLFNVFRDVQNVSSPNDSAYLKQQGIAYVFVPTVHTESSSSGVLTWMPTHFIVSLSCIAYDSDGKQVWQHSVSGTGDAEFHELKGDFSAAARKASQNAFGELEKAIIGASELH